MVKNWKFRGGGGGLREIPSVVGVWIFSGTTQFTKTIIPFVLVGYKVIITNSRYALVGYFITSYPMPAHGIIVKWS